MEQVLKKIFALGVLAFGVSGMPNPTPVPTPTPTPTPSPSPGGGPCSSGETFCVVNIYNSAGDIINRSVQCEAPLINCPCDVTWERNCNNYQCERWGTLCPDECESYEYECWMMGVKYCLSTAAQCPCADQAMIRCPDGACVYGNCGQGVECLANQDTCFINGYDRYGYMVGGTNVCVNQTAQGYANCPCNMQWERQCVSDYGGYNVTYCVPSSSCCSDETYCSVNIYDATGSLTGYNDTCIPHGQSCPCSQGENRCYTSYFSSSAGQYVNHSYCTQYQCPCSSSEQYCWQYAYDTNGVWLPDYNYSCATTINQCQCMGSNSLSTPCEYQYGDFFCAPATGSCPAVCSSDEMVCYMYKYVDGWPDYSNYTQSCVSNTLPICPCNTAYENQCGSGIGAWCQSKAYPCPLDCSATGSCWGYQYHPNTSFVTQCDSWGCWPIYREYCRAQTSSNCSCRDQYEWTCADPTGNFCLPKIEYSGCPLNCGSQYSCREVDYNTDGTYKMGGGAQFCASTYDECYNTCGTNSHSCGSWCQWSGNACPLDCGTDGTNQTCYTHTYDTTTGYWLSSTEFCHPANQKCPCMSTEVRCYPNEEWSYCVPSTIGCPLLCNSTTHHYCSGASFFANGSFDDSTKNADTCQLLNTTCPCGNNAISCGVFDPISNSTNYYCSNRYYSTVGRTMQLSCPVTCTGVQQLCFVSNYDAVGNVEDYQEICVPSTAPCPCGRNSTHCTDEYGSFCMPRWDSALNRAYRCPEHCTTNQILCSIPNFDGQGQATFNNDYCSPVGTPCNCSLGTNAKSCTTSWMAGGNTYSHTECMYKGKYCPVTCTGSKIQCPEMETFTRAGAFLDYVPPPDSEACKDNWNDCPCGQGAVKCTAAGVSTCHSSARGCPRTCSSTQKICYVVDFTTAGAVNNDKSSKCVPQNSACPCGANAQKCTIDTVGLGNLDECVPKQDPLGNRVCPCASGEKVCFVVNYNTKGVATGVEKRCAKLEGQCPCGQNTKQCIDAQDTSIRSCEPSFGRGSSCPAPCTIDQEIDGNKTCLIASTDSLGNPAGARITCQKECTPGPGFKSCPTGSIILAGFGCKDIYGLLTSGGPGGGRRLVASHGQRQTSSLTFYVDNLQSQPPDVSKQKQDLDSILQLHTSIKTTLGVTYTSGQAEMKYAVTNLGTSPVTPQESTDKLKGYLNARNSEVVTALAAIGTIKIGDNGCCSISTSQKTIAVSNRLSTTTTTATALPTSTSPTSAAPPTSPSPSGNTPTPSPTPAPPTPSPSGNTPTPAPPPTTTTTTTTTAAAVATHKQITGGFAMQMNQSQAASALGNPAFKTAVHAGVANHTGVSPSQVQTTFTLASGGRRLTDEQERRLSMATIQVAYTITLPASQYSHAQQQALHSAVSAMTASDITTAVNQQLASAGFAHDFMISVTSVTAPTLEAMAPPGNTTTTRDVSIEDNYATRGRSFGIASLIAALGFAA